MELYIQMGHGMQSLCKDLTEYWKKSTVILSPRNISPDKLKFFSRSLKKVGGQVLFDPQMYSHFKYCKNLQKYDYFPKTSFTSIEIDDWSTIISILNKINSDLDTQSFILPSLTIGKVSDIWCKVQNIISREAKLIVNCRKLLHTISITSDVMMDVVQVEKIVQSVNQWDVDGVYIVCEHPGRYYLVGNPIWMANLLTLVTGIKRQKKDVIVANANHQYLCLSLAKCNAIASGRFFNVRYFLPEYFETDNSERGRRLVWYYCPQALSEFKIIYLDIAQRAELIPAIAPPSNMINKFSKILFQDVLPSLTGYNKSDSLKHYLHCLKIQCESATRSNYQETLNLLMLTSMTASSIIYGLRKEKIKGQERDFNESIDANEAAMSILDKENGLALSQEWNML
jgi:hypothetical protein